jgi:Protein of unknown function (DUF2917)
MDEWRNEMAIMTFQSYVNAGIPGFGSSSTAKSRVAGAAEAASPIVRPVALDRGNVLRIKNGRGTRVRAASGVLWITEENSPEDHSLLQGDAIDLTQKGTAIVFAHRPARVILELPRGVVPPGAVEMALADGEPGRSIALATPTPISLSTIARGLATVLGEASASIRMMVKTLTSRWNAADVSTAETYAPMMYSDGFPPRHLRRRMMRGTREVERVIIDEWMLWRM